MVVRSTETRRSARDDRVRNYFYGIKGNFYPHSFEVRFADIKIFKIGGKLLLNTFKWLIIININNNHFASNVL